MSKILHLTLKKKWFDMILSGEKKEEYREFKPYWINRFKKNCSYRIIRFTNGYGKDKPSFDIELKQFDYNRGLVKWGAEKNKKYFVLRLGKVINKRNIKK